MNYEIFFEKQNSGITMKRIKKAAAKTFPSFTTAFRAYLAQLSYL